MQLPLHAALESHRFVVATCHRRFGKTVMSINELLKRAVECQLERPRYAYISPSFVQGKQIAWDYLVHFSAPIPGVEVNHSELRVDLPNGAQIRIYGADNPDRLRGVYFDGVVLDEVGLMPSRIFSEVIAPTLSDREGWALFIGTPNGRNVFYDLTIHAQTTPGWHYTALKASDTGVLSPEELAIARSSMTEDSYAQEYECSFEASVKGAIFGKEMAAASENGRICRVPYETMLPVDTFWDLGIGDATAIWFAQTTPSGEIRLIDYVEDHDQPLSHYIGLVKSKPYTYGDHWAPHDIAVREFTTGLTRLSVARSHGIDFRVGKQLKVEDGINAMRMILGRCWFDSVACSRGLAALHGYRWKGNPRLDSFNRAQPEHDDASHGADAFRLLALQSYTPSAKAILTFERAQITRDLARAHEASGAGESLAESMKRLALIQRANRDHDPSDVVRRTRGRGGW
jgi:phage terminase large subunit|tara:strand:+ start:383 stop:1756 length:1374 start_codon:yes stop_codon:yes gene_type:complete